MLLGRPGWPLTPTDSPVSTSQVLGLKVFGTGHFFFYYIYYINKFFIMVLMAEKYFVRLDTEYTPQVDSPIYNSNETAPHI